MNAKKHKILFFSALILFHAHMIVALHSYYVPKWITLAALTLTVIVAKFFLKHDGLRTISETIFTACVLNIPFGAGGYIYRPWTILAAAAACLLPPMYFITRKKNWRPAFRWSFIAVISIGFLVSAWMRSDLGKRCSKANEHSAARTFEMMPSYDNPYGVYVAPGGCPSFSCYSMERKIGSISCDEKASYTDVGGNPQRMAADPARNRIYFPVRGTPAFVVAQIEPYVILKTVTVPGAESLLNADVRMNDGLIAIVDEKRHVMFAVDPESFKVRFTASLGWGAAYSVAVDQARDYAFVSDWAGGFLHRVNLANGSVKKRWIGLSSFSIKTDSENGLVYLTRPFRSMVAVVDAETLEVVRALPAGYGARDIALDPLRNRIIIGNYFDGSVDVVDFKSGKRSARYDIGPLVRGVAVDTSSGIIYSTWTCGLSKLK